MLLSKLKPVENAYCSTEENDRCLETTRIALRERIDEWIGYDYSPGEHDGLADNVFWLHGMAGIGKTTVANTVAHMVNERKLPLSCFFCKRDDPERSDPKRLFPTLASRFAKWHSTFCEPILALLQGTDDLGATTGDLNTQFSRLFGAIISSVATPLQVHVVVIDALDECGDARSQEIVARNLLELAELAPWVRIFVTSRDEPRIVKALRERRRCIARDLGQEEQTESDIRYYIDNRLARLNTTLRADRIDTLVQRAGGLFIWCSALFNYVGGGDDANGDLQDYFDNPSVRDEWGLYGLYDNILARASSGRQQDIRRQRRFLGVVCLVANNRPLPARATLAIVRANDASLKNATDDLGERLVGSLHAVLFQDPNMHGAVRVHHQSFLDFLQERMDHSPDWERPVVLHQMIAANTLTILNKSLKFNICNITLPILNNNIPNLPEQIASNISHELQYSALFWTAHLEALPSPSKDETIRAQITQFLPTVKILFWLEVLSLLGEVARGATMLAKCVELFPVRS